MQNKIFSYDTSYLYNLRQTNKSVICAVCHYPLEYPVRCEKNNSLICNQCINHSNHQCDLIHDQNNYSINGNHLIEPTLSKLQVICKENHTNGCKWIGKRSKYINHLNECKQNFINCPFCLVKIAKTDIDHKCSEIDEWLQLETNNKIGYFLKKYQNDNKKRMKKLYTETKTLTRDIGEYELYYLMLFLFNIFYHVVTVSIMEYKGAHPISTPNIIFYICTLIVYFCNMLVCYTYIWTQIPYCYDNVSTILADTKIKHSMYISKIQSFINLLLFALTIHITSCEYQTTQLTLVYGNTLISGMYLLLSVLFIIDLSKLQNLIDHTKVSFI